MKKFIDDELEERLNRLNKYVIKKDYSLTILITVFLLVMIIGFIIPLVLDFNRTNLCRESTNDSNLYFKYQYDVADGLISCNFFNKSCPTCLPYSTYIEVDWI